MSGNRERRTIAVGVGPDFISRMHPDVLRVLYGVGPEALRYTVEIVHGHEVGFVHVAMPPRGRRKNIIPALQTTMAVKRLRQAGFKRDDAIERVAVRCEGYEATHDADGTPILHAWKPEFLDIETVKARMKRVKQYIKILLKI